MALAYFWVAVASIAAAILLLALSNAAANSPRLAVIGWRSLLVLLLLLNATDLLTTWLGLTRGVAKEGNFIPALIVLTHGEYWFAAYKLIVGSIVFFAIARLSAQNRSFRKIAFTIIMVFLIVTIWNSAILFMAELF